MVWTLSGVAIFKIGFPVVILFALCAYAFYLYGKNKTSEADRKRFIELSARYRTR